MRPVFVAVTVPIPPPESLYTLKERPVPTVLTPATERYVPLDAAGIVVNVVTPLRVLTAPCAKSNPPTEEPPIETVSPTVYPRPGFTITTPEASTLPSVLFLEMLKVAPDPPAEEVPPTPVYV